MRAAFSKRPLLVSAAETAYRFGRVDRRLPKDDLEHVVSILRDAMALDAKNRRAELLLERVHRQEGRWEELARAIEQYADEAHQKEEKVAGWLRLARVFSNKIGSPERAVAAFERVIDLSPG